MALHPLRIIHTDTARHEAFLRYVPRIFPRVDFRSWYLRGGWTSAYEAFALAEADEIVANVSVMRMRLLIGGREVRGAQLGAVGCVPEVRGRGLMRSLLERVLAQLDSEADLVWLYANERNQERIARNSYCKRAGGAKSARGGMALLGGLLRCRRCGRMLSVTYGGRGIRRPRYSCVLGNSMHGVERCISFGAVRPDATIAKEILVAVQPMAVEAAIVAAREVSQQIDEARRALELEQEQAEYEAKLATRRYEKVDPDNRLVAAELEARWNAALARQRECEAKLAASQVTEPPAISPESMFGLAKDLEAAWNAPSTTMRTRQQLVRTLIEEIVVDVDDATREVVLVVHWRGGQHSELRVRKPATGEHTRRAPEEAGGVIREMAGRWSDADIAATLNRMGFSTGQGNTWNESRVRSYRQKNGIRAYESAVKDGQCLTMLEAAQKLDVSCYQIRKLIREGLLPAGQVLFDAPWQILAADLDRPEVQAALRHRARRGRPCRNSRDNCTLKIPGT